MQAEDRSQKLLLSHLTPAQQRDLLNNYFFDTVGSSGRLYRIKWMHVGHNVTWMRRGKPFRSYCAHPANYLDLPTADVILAQKMAVETDDRKFTKIACALGYDRNGKRTLVLLPPVHRWLMLGLIAFGVANIVNAGLHLIALFYR